MLNHAVLPGRIIDGECFSSNGTASIQGESVAYRTDAQEFLFLDADNETEASIFAFTILKEEHSEKNMRPVIFVYGGGPGAASAELYFGMFGPHTFPANLEEQFSPVPPYQIEENADFLLDVCDIVLVDPVGTGYSKMCSPENAKKYLGLEADAAASRRFIAHWLYKYKRWNCPKFICGKSYGGMRCATYPYYFLGGSLDPQLGQFGIALNGTIILCDTNVGDFQSMVNPRMSAPNQPPSINLIPTFAAINHYHNPENKPQLRMFIDEAYQFAYNEYAHALLIGSAISQEEKMSVMHRLSYFTGLPVAVFEKMGIAIDISTFGSTILEAQGKSISLYDGRFSRAKIAAGAPLYDTSSDDALLLSLWSMEVAMVHEYMRGSLGINWDREYSVQNYNVGWNWDFTMSKPASANELLFIAANRNPGMNIFFGKGIYDCVTPIGDGRYTLNHYGLPEDRITYKEYESGHAIWLGKEAKKAILSDLREFILHSI